MKHTTKALAVFLFALAVALGLLPGMATTAKAPWIRIHTKFSKMCSGLL